MKRQMLTLLLGLTLPLLSAADAGYLSATLSRVTYEESGAPDFAPLAAGLRIGGAMNEHVSLEVRLGLGIKDDSARGVDLKMDSYLGGFARFMLPVNERVAVYALLGAARAKLTADNGLVSVSDSEKGLGYGLGAEMDLGPRAFAIIEYGRLVSGDDYDLDALTLGLGRRF